MKDLHVKNVHDTPFGYTMSLIRGKYKLLLLYELKACKVMRYSDFMKAIPEITHKMLTQQLKELEADGLVIRTEYAQVPPKVEYTLSEKGLSMSGILDEICWWGHRNGKE